MRFQSLLPIAAAVLAACSSDDAPGVLTHGIIAGQNQTAIAGSVRLTDAVVEGISRTRDGRIVMRRIDPERMLDLVVPRAFAQGTVVKGSPVAGAVVCVGDAQGLTAFVPCTNTDVGGMATFFFTPSTKAGLHTAEIRGTVAGAPVVFDTARATVVVGAAAPNQQWNFGPIGPSPATLHASAVEDAYRNPVPYRIVGDGRLVVQDTVVGSVGARTVVFTEAMRDTVLRLVEFRGTLGVLVARAKYRLVIDNNVTAIEWRIYGTALVP